MEEKYYEEIYTEPFDGIECSICKKTNTIFDQTEMGLINERIFCVDCIEKNNLIDEKIFLQKNDDAKIKKMREVFREKEIVRITNWVKSSFIQKEIKIDFSQPSNEINYEYIYEKNIMSIKSQLINALIDLEFAKSNIVPKLNKINNINNLERKVNFISEYLKKHLKLGLYDSYENYSDNFLMEFYIKKICR